MEALPALPSAFPCSEKQSEYRPAAPRVCVNREGGAHGKHVLWDKWPSEKRPSQGQVGQFAEEEREISPREVSGQLLGV